tara:strand:- start:114 stop:518 length:405 start_codon:yes stop_codon:yes gene_type:complete
MSEIKSHIPTLKSSEKSFGIVFSVVFLIIGLYPIIGSNALNYWAIAISILFLLMAYFSPKFLSLPNKLWFRFGIFLGSIIAPIVMALIFFVAVFPTGLIMRLFGKDLLSQKFNKKIKTYWIERSEAMGSMKNQF